MDTGEKPRLLVIAGSLEGLEYSLSLGETSIGREPSNDLPIGDRLISRRHCRLTAEQVGRRLQYTIIDLASANGTYVNDLRIEKQALSDGDTIRIGGTKLRFIDAGRGSSGGQMAMTERLAIEDTAIEFDDAPIESLPAVSVPPERSTYLAAEGGTESPSSEDSARRIDDARKLFRISLELSALRDMETLAEKLGEVLQDLLPSEFGALLMFEEAPPEGQDFLGPVHVLQNAYPSKTPPRVSRTLLRRVRETGRAVMVNDPLSDESFQLAESLWQVRVHSLIAAPMRLGDRVAGALYLSSSNPAIRFGQPQLDLLTAITGLAEKTVETIRQFQLIRTEKLRLQQALGMDREMIGDTPQMQSVRELIATVAPANSTVLIQGESGTGKELVALAIHANSPRKAGPFIPINCAALSENLLESELFGHERGSFTGAIGTKKGRLEIANGGTVFLDEIGDLAPALQAKLLRVLQEREMVRVGGLKTIKLDIRVLAATNRNLEAALADGRFRQDLYYRLNVVQVKLPPLRERRADIPSLAAHFLQVFAARNGRRVPCLRPEAEELLRTYSWPGNIRELESAMETAVLFCEGEWIRVEDLPAQILAGDPRPAPAQAAAALVARPDSLYAAPMAYRDAVREARRQILLRAFALAGHSHAEAARLLGLHPNNLHREIRNLGLKEQLRNQPASK